MSKHLTITRLGLLTVPSRYAAPPLFQGDVVSAFRKQAELFARLYPPTAISPQTMLVGIPFDNSEGGRKETKQPGEFAAFLALLPPFTWNIGDEWLVRGRVSITSYDLQGQVGRGKIWLTLAGMPADKFNNDDANASVFLDRINEMEARELKALKNAYRESLKAVSNEHASSLAFEDALLKISVSDDDTTAVASLVDAIYFDGVEPSQISNSQDKDVREGLKKLEDFVSHAGAGSSILDQGNLSIESSVPGIKGIICNGRFTHYASLVAGFARRAGDGGGYQRVLDQLDEQSPLSFDQMWARSAALPLSERLAETEARKWDRGHLALAL
jgi:hypothetical protein